MTKLTPPVARAHRLGLALGLVALLATPAVAGASDDAQHLKGYKARGLVVATTPTTVTVCVGTAKKSTSKRAVAWRGMPVVFDVTALKLKVRDIDGDGSKDLEDVQTGDRVKVAAKLPQDLSLATSPYAARKLSVSYKAKVKPKHGFDGGVCPAWDDDDESELPESEDYDS